MTDTTQAAPVEPTVAPTGSNGSAPRRGSLSAMRLPELQAVAAELGISGTARMRKSDLLEAIRSRQGGAPAGSPSGSSPATEAAPAAAPAGRRATRHAGSPSGSPSARAADQGTLPLGNSTSEAAPAAAPAAETAPAVESQSSTEDAE